MKKNKKIDGGDWFWIIILSIIVIILFIIKYKILDADIPTWIKFLFTA